jgi:hypothetical protein
MTSDFYAASLLHRRDTTPTAPPKPLAFRGLGHFAARTENPRVGGSIPPPGTLISARTSGPLDRKVGRAF